ncbi:MAG: c-type cytochrome [Bacteroidota bacterium]|jgi:cytochrome c551|nr:cytochrome c [Saprospiraceae bacterium]
MNKTPFLLIIAALSLERCMGTHEGGQRIYASYCANCHLDDGKGLGALIPPLANSDYLAANRKKLPLVIRYGLQDTIVVNGVVYAEKMAGMPGLNEIQVTNLLNYIGQSWGNNIEPFTFDEVKKTLDEAASLRK